jgi:hypothetical protein
MQYGREHRQSYSGADEVKSTLWGFRADLAFILYSEYTVPSPKDVLS